MRGRGRGGRCLGWLRKAQQRGLGKGKAQGRQRQGIGIAWGGQARHRQPAAQWVLHGCLLLESPGWLASRPPLSLCPSHPGLPAGCLNIWLLCGEWSLVMKRAVARLFQPSEGLPLGARTRNAEHWRGGVDLSDPLHGPLSRHSLIGDKTRHPASIAPQAIMAVPADQPLRTACSGPRPRQGMGPRPSAKKWGPKVRDTPLL